MSRGLLLLELDRFPQLIRLPGWENSPTITKDWARPEVPAQETTTPQMKRIKKTATISHDAVRTAGYRFAVIGTRIFKIKSASMILPLVRLTA